MEPPCDSRVIRLAENHSPDFGCVFHQLDVAVRMNFAVQRGKEVHEIDGFDFVIRPERVPGFLQGSSRGQMPTTCGGGCDENAHGFKASQSSLIVSELA